MASGKPRPHKGAGGRPSNKKRIDDLTAQNLRLRTLIAGRKLGEPTWMMIDKLLQTIQELDELNTPLQAAQYGTGHTADEPVLPGVYLAPIEGDRNLYHGGRYAAYLNEWLHEQVTWAISTIQHRLTGAEQDPKPRPPKKALIDDNAIVT